MSDFFDDAAAFREQFYIQHQHATAELTEETLSIAYLMLVVAGVAALYWVLS